MRNAFVVVTVVVLTISPGSPTPPARFEKVTEHLYQYQPGLDEPTVGAVISDDGVLLINPPQEPNLAPLMAALKQITPRAVRWVVSTDYRLARAAELPRWTEQGAVVLGSKRLWKLLAAGGTGSRDTSATQPEAENPKPEAVRPGKAVSTRLEFEHQIHLFPGGLEVRILALESSALTAGDIVVLIPSERVLQVGALFMPGSYPVIDLAPGEGSALEWIDGLRQVIDAVPQYKAAIPQPKQDPGKGSAPEKTQEELVSVVPFRGPRCSLQEMKDVLEMSQKLRGELAKIMAAGGKREDFLMLPALAPFRVYANFDTYATQLFDAIAVK